MWTPENRLLYDRDKLRYPSDLTDAEWQHIGPVLPPAKRGGGKRTFDPREVVNGVMYVLSTDVSGAIFRKTCRRAARCMTTSPGGATTARWRKSITRSTSNAASRTKPRPVPLPASSIARA